MWKRFVNVNVNDMTSCISGPSFLSKDHQSIWERDITSMIRGGLYVPIRKIIKFLDIELLYVKNPGWAGACRIINDNAYIWIDCDLDYYKQNYIISLMLGAILKNGKHKEYEYKTLLNETATTGNREYWIFAKNLLVPDYLFNTWWSHSVSGCFDAKISIKDTIKSLWNKEIRKQIKEKVDYHNKNRWKMFAEALQVPYIFLMEIMSYKFRP